MATHSLKNLLAGFNGICRKLLADQQNKLQAWQWFLLLYFLGFSSLMLLAFFLKLLIKAL